MLKLFRQKRKAIEKLDKSQLEDLKKHLSIKDSIDGDLIVIIYYSGKDRFIASAVNSSLNHF